MKRLLVLLALGAGLAACGGAAYGVNASAPANAARTPAKLKLRMTKLGHILVDSHGRTLYMFGKDTRNRSRCAGACAGNWPPLTTSGRTRAGSGVSARLLGTTRRKGGARQVTYAGHPLYRFVGDSRAGDTTGQGLSAFGARWFAVTSSGRRAHAAPKPIDTPPPGY